MIVSIEIPVIKGQWLKPCIDSVVSQTSSDWRLYLLWDEGDELSKKILKEIEARNDPRIKVYFQKRMGIANARRFLTDHSSSDFILPVDDDDIITPDAVEKLLAAAKAMPWSGIVRSRRGYIDENGKLIDMPEWFPFEPRRYFRGMTTDLFNQAHPYIIRRTVYEKTAGWDGFREYMYAGEDCDIFLKIEEHAEIELIEDCLYYYRINPERTSNKLGDPAAIDMWQRLADKTIERRNLPLKRVNSKQPFEYIKQPTVAPSRNMVDIVVPFWESNEEELSYIYSRPSQDTTGDVFVFDGMPQSAEKMTFRQTFDDPLPTPDRIELVCSSTGPVSGTVRVSFYSDDKFHSPVVTASHLLKNASLACEFLSLNFDKESSTSRDCSSLEIIFIPDGASENVFMLHVWRKNINNLDLINRSYYFSRLLNWWEKKRGRSSRIKSNLWMRLFRKSPGFARKRLEGCLRSLRKAGIPDSSIIVIEKRQSSAANRNEGVRRSSKPYICFLDDDVEIISEEVFDVLLEKMHIMDVDLIGPKIITEDGMIFCADPYFNDQLMPNPSGLGEKDTGKYDYSSIVPWLPSTFFIVKREVFSSVGGFDENYVGSQHEDVDFCLKARSRGFRCAYVGEVAVKHYNFARNNSHSVNYDYFMRRWQKHKHLFISCDDKNLARL